MESADRESYLKRRYGGSQAFVNKREQRFVADLLARYGPFERVIDIPCGHGRFTPQLRTAARRELVCGDHDKRHIDALVAAESDAGTAIVTKECDMYDPLPFADDEFDLVFTFRFFHHIEQDEQRIHVIHELARIAKKYLIISYYYDAALHSLQKRLWKRKGHKHRLPMISRTAFRELFARENCRLLEDFAVIPGIHAQRIALLEKGTV
jgi:SAM-dependent methyltransferase